VELQPLGAKLIFRNTNTMAGPQSRIVEGAVSLTLLPIAQTYPFPQQEFVGGSASVAGRCQLHVAHLMKLHSELSPDPESVGPGLAVEAEHEAWRPVPRRV